MAISEEKSVTVFAPSHIAYQGEECCLCHVCRSERHNKKKVRVVCGRLHGLKNEEIYLPYSTGNKRKHDNITILGEVTALLNMDSLPFELLRAVQIRLCYWHI